jgi:predicted CopG family antitoxin
MSETQIVIEKSVYERTKHIAEEKGMSVSGYVNELLKKNAEGSPRKGHTMKYFGAIKDESFNVPDDRPES